MSGMLHKLLITAVQMLNTSRLLTTPCHLLDTLLATLVSNVARAIGHALSHIAHFIGYTVSHVVHVIGHTMSHVAHDILAHHVT